MSLIEQAARRLEELRRAGVEVPDTTRKQDISADGALGRSGAIVSDPADPSVKAASSLDPQGPSAPSAATPSHPRHVELNLAHLASAGFVTPDVPRSRLADEIRVLKRPLIANASGKGAAPIRKGNLIMVTSSVPGEGKTFSAINLAMSIAMELDRTVLLVDADVARPTLPDILGLPSTKGMLDVLQDKSIDLGKVLLRTSVDKLTVLTGGTQHPRANELLASDAMARLLAEIESRYADRIIIFDSPPLLVTTEARVLATQMGQIVFVVKAETTLRREVKQALSTIETCPVKMIVLNQARTKAQGAYGYGYGYGYYHGS